MRKVKISELFTIIKGKSLYTKTYGSNHHGEYPVFSASNQAPLTYINHYDFEGKYMTWATNGFAGYIKIIDGKFSINGDRGIMIPRYEKISIEYVKFALEPLLRELAKGRRGDNNENEFTKVYPRMVENTEIDFPIDEKGIIDEEKQQELVGVYLVIDEVKQRIAEYQQQLEQLTITVAETSYPMKEVRIDEIFDFQRGRVISQGYVRDNAGEYPVYSSNTKEGGLFGMIKTYDYDCEGLTWTTDGVHAGTIVYRSGRFSITNVCGLMTVKLGIHDIYLPYIEKLLDFRKIATGDGNKKVMTNVILSNEISISIPILPDGSFDLTAQHQIAQTYETISQIKSQMLTKMQELQDVQVVV